MERALRLQDKVALVVGGGQTPGATTGNGRATALVFAREGARVAVADRSLESAEETVRLIRAEGGDAVALTADVTDEASVEAMIGAVTDRWSRLDVLHNNVGVSLAGGDAVVEEIDLAAFDRVTAINLRGMVATCKHAIPVMRAQGGGAIVNMGSLASRIDYPYIAYRTSKAGVVALTENLAIRLAPDGIRANVILPGLMDTPMAIENRVGMGGATREQVVEQRNAKVPLRRRMGTGWDVAYAALYLASDEAGFVTGTVLTVDGGQALAAG